MTELKIGHYYRLKAQDPHFQKYIVIHEVSSSGPGGTRLVTYQYFGNEQVIVNTYTDPDIWEEI